MIPRSKVKLISEWDRWDGPTAGIAMVNGRRLFFRLHDEKYLYHWWSFLTKLLRLDMGGEDRYRVRIFWLYDLPPDIWKHFDERHADFIKYVGTHCEYDENGKLSGTQKDHSQYHLFYDKWKPGSAPKMKDEWHWGTYKEVGR